MGKNEENAGVKNSPGQTSDAKRGTWWISTVEY